MVNKSQIFVCLLLILPAEVWAGKVEVEAAADATVLMDMPGENRGADAAVWAFSGPPGHAGDAAKSYLRFEVGPSEGKIADVAFVATYTSKLDRSAEVWLLPEAPQWDEHAITWYNAPGNDTASPHLLTEAVMLGTIGGRGAGNETSLEFSDDSAKEALLDALNAPPRKVTLVIVQRPYTQASTVTLASKESTAYPGPRLVIDVAAKK